MEADWTKLFAHLVVMHRWLVNLVAAQLAPTKATEAELRAMLMQPTRTLELLRFPGLSPEQTELLVKESGIVFEQFAESVLNTVRQMRAATPRKPE